MMSTNAHSENRDRLTELLLDRALQGLESDESQELHSLTDGDEAFESAFDPGGFEQAAALAAIALIGTPERMPHTARARLNALARSSNESERAVQIPSRLTNDPQATGVSASGSVRPLRLTAWGGWFAAAACLAMAVLAWWPQINRAPSRDPAEMRARLLIDRPADLVMWSWSPGNDPANPSVSGDIVWSDQRQQGYMRFTGLTRNDPSIEQYQLWIFDAQRKAEYPVDGGVFDVNADGEVVIPIDPKLGVFKATMFAVTVEKPGGVARSERERIAALALPPA